MIYSDTHAHLDFDSFDLDRDLVIQRAKAVGLRFILNIGIDLEGAEKSIALARQYPDFIYAVVGIHPNYSSNFDASVFRKLETLAKEPEVVAIGEIGLDFYRDHATPEQQHRALEAQLELATRLGLPIVVHERSSAQELVPILTSWQRSLPADHALKSRPGVMHSYSASIDYTHSLLESNFVFGIGGPVTYKNGKDKQALVSALPIESMLLETDCPFLPPHPHRGKRNEPAYIPLIAQKIAEIRGMEVEDIGKQLTKNAGYLFNLDQILK